MKLITIAVVWFWVMFAFYSESVAQNKVLSGMAEVRVPHLRPSQIQVPTLLILGEREIPDIFAIGKLLQEQVKGIQTKRIAKSEHLVNIEIPISKPLILKQKEETLWN